VADENLSSGGFIPPVFANVTSASVAVNALACTFSGGIAHAAAAISTWNTASVGSSASRSSGGSGGCSSGGRSTRRAISAADTALVDNGAVDDSDGGLDTEVGFGGVAFGEEDVHGIVGVTG